MNRTASPTPKRNLVRTFLLAALALALALPPLGARPAIAATTLSVSWTAGGLSAGSDSAGQAARMAVDASGNVAIVSGPSLARDLAVTSYTSIGGLRWRSAVSPSSGTVQGDWAAFAPNGDVVAVGHNISSKGQPIAITLVRFAANGALQWRVDLARTIPSVARLLVDAGGNAYLAFNSVGDGQDIQLLKYSASGTQLWSQLISTGFFANDIATSLAFGPDESDIVLTGDISGGASWITAAYDTATGVRKWLVTAAEGTAARDVVVDASQVYVTGQGNVGIATYLTVVAYDRATGARLWRTDKRPADGQGAAGLRMAKAADGSIVVTGQASRGFLDWYTVALATTGTVRWEAVRDGGLNTDEIPAGVLVLPSGTTVVTGRGGPNLPGGYIQGVTAGYSASGALIWEAFSRLETVWAAALPNGNVCATGGYDALVTCFVVGGFTSLEPVAVMSATPASGPAPLTVAFDGSGSIPASNPLASWTWAFGDGTFGSGVQITHVYQTPGTYTASLTVTDSLGASGSTPKLIVVNAPVPTPTPLPTSMPPASLSTGFLAPSANAAQKSGAGDGNGYQNSPANAYVDDSSAAGDINSGTNTSLACTDNGKDKHRYSNYNFNLPGAAVIQGIQVRLDARADATSGSPKICVQLSGDGGTTWTAAQSTASLGTSEAAYMLGGPSDTWGGAWTPGSFSNANFRLRVIDVASNTNRDFYLDYVAVNITYQP